MSGSDPVRDQAGGRYEPTHLRHRPGDDWEIGGKPHDPDDPGPYGSPNWYQDRRTGRHRRGELPDPLPVDDRRPRIRPEPGPYRFDRLREGAWNRFLVVSAPLAAAHDTPQPRRHAVTRREAGLVWAVWNLLMRRLFVLLNGSSERREERQRLLPRSVTPYPSPTVDPGQSGAPAAASPLRRTGPAERTAAMVRAIDGARRARTEAAAWA